MLHLLLYVIKRQLTISSNHRSPSKLACVCWCLWASTSMADITSVDIITQWREDWSSASVVNHTIVTDSTIRQPGFDLPRHTRSLINRFQTSQGPFRANLHNLGLAQSLSCDCGQRQTRRKTHGQTEPRGGQLASFLSFSNWLQRISMTELWLASKCWRACSINSFSCWACARMLFAIWTKQRSQTNKLDYCTAMETANVTLLRILTSSLPSICIALQAHAVNATIQIITG